MPVPGAGAGCGAGAGRCELAVRVVESARGGDRAPVLGAACPLGGDRVPGAGAVSWLSARLRRAAALVGRWRRCRCCQLAKRAGAGVS